MSWKLSIMVQRAEFVRLASVEGQEFSEACSRFGIIRKTGYKWIARFKEEGESGLADRSRRPKKSPSKSSKKTESIVLKLREKHPQWGGRKLRQRLLDLNHLNVPSASTITSILGRHGLLSELDGAGDRHALQRFERESPNELWQMDFKGHFAMVGGGRCHPLTVLDDHSRYSIGIRACENEQASTVKRELVTMFRQYGLPVQMLMDNGSPRGRFRRPAMDNRDFLASSAGDSCLSHSTSSSSVARKGRTLPSDIEGGSSSGSEPFRFVGMSG